MSPHITEQHLNIMLIISLQRTLSLFSGVRQEFDLGRGGAENAGVENAGVSRMERQYENILRKP